MTNTRNSEVPPPLPLSRRDVQLLALAAPGIELAELTRALQLRPSAVERHLIRLDRSAGMLLTRRAHQAVRLTSAGHRLLAVGQRFFSQVDRVLLATIHGFGEGVRESPRVLAISTADPAVEEAVEEVADQLGILLAVSHAAPDQVLLQFDAYRADAVYTWWFGDPRIDLRRPARVHAAFSEPIFAYLPYNHPKADQDVVSLASMSEDCWVSEAGPGSEPAVVRVYRTAGLTVPNRLHVTSASVARGMLRRGGVVGLGTALSPGVRDRSFRCVPITERPSRSAGLVADPCLLSAETADRLGRMVAGRHRERQPAELAVLAELKAQPPFDLEALHEADFRLLHAVAEYGSINRAATVLSISQSALTRRVYRLEQRIGAPLLRRGPSGTTLTGPAQQFLDQLTALEGEFREAVRALGPGYRIPAVAMHRSSSPS